MVKNFVQKAKDYFAENFWLAAFLFFQIAFPLLWMHNASNTDIGNRILANCLYFLITFGCFSVTKGIFRRILLILFFIITIIPNGIVLGFFEMNQSVLKSCDFWVVFDTNLAEATGFLSMITPAIIVKISLYIATTLLFLVLTIRKKQKPQTRKARLLCTCIAMIVWGGCSSLVYFRSNVSSIDFYKSWLNYKQEMKALITAYENRKDVKITAKCYLPNMPKTFVVVIGESATKRHHGIYGYPRNTTPHLDSIKNELLIFQDVTCPVTNTLKALQQILTFANYENPKAYLTEPSIIEIANAVGYKTFWFDNNQMCGEENALVYSYHPLVKTASEYHINNEYQQQDEWLFPLFEKALQDTS